MTKSTKLLLTLLNQDLATAHITATICPIPSAFGQCLRLIISARQFTYEAFCEILRTNVPALAERIPQGLPSKDAAEEGVHVLSNVRAVEVLGEGLVFRPMEETVVELAKQLLEIERDEEGREEESGR